MSWRASMSEKDWQSMVIDLFRLQGWMVYHTFDSRRSEPGFPDLVCAHDDHGVLFIELKSEKGRVSKAQERWLARLRRAGARAFMLRPSDWPLVENMAAGNFGRPGEAEIVADADELFGQGEVFP